MLNERNSGVLLHISSLPGRFGIGDLGPEAYNFVNFLIETGQKVWEVLPMGPTGFGNSPYSCASAFAGNINYISFEKLRDLGFLSDEEINNTPEYNNDHVDFGAIYSHKNELLRLSFQRFKDSTDENIKNEFMAFCDANNYWLDDYAMFTAVKEEYAASGHVGDWTQWDRSLALHVDQAIDEKAQFNGDDVLYHKYLQFSFFRQWFELKAYANERGIKLLGDIPIYIAFDSADVWANAEIFELDENRSPKFVTGIPDDFEGQIWGHPHYNWEVLRSRGYDWSVKRLGKNLEMYDMIRLDHFVGYDSQFYIPFGADNANVGEWRQVPGDELMNAYSQAFGENLPIVVEDFGGQVTPRLFEIRDNHGLAGMKILLSAFNGDPGNGNLPENFDKENYISYTGNHDNNTVRGWFYSIHNEHKQQVLEKTQTDGSNISWDMIKMNLFTIANLAVCQMQDILDLDEKTRMNNPGTVDGNWTWRFQWEAVTDQVKIALKSLTEESGR